MKIHRALALSGLLVVAASGCDPVSGADAGSADAGGADAGGSPDAYCPAAFEWYVENASGQAKPVGEKQPNPFGLYDMLGNAVEWVSDCYHASYTGAPADGSSWDEAVCDYRIVRGGCYGSTARGIRVSVRDGVTPSFYGACAPTIRCVRTSAGGGNPLITPTWVHVPAGTLDMGCSAGDDQCADNELPSHPVSVGAFEMTATELTQQQYFDQTGEAPPSTYYCPECAVTYVMWDAAKAFCEALGGRLPTEAEWEYAARGGTTGRYYCGD
ncbi:MAG: SUMF1/EgtB/PvdO family nonheme iron enzyme [Deltaproteobacteria bacterium]|nr:SUMF1/EgtB/PvdO family nonheme iron enzyme [Deltaproteobacteria bacterium]